MAETEITSLTTTSLVDKLEFLEVHESLMNEMLSIENSKFTLHSHMFSSSILASINKHRDAVAKGDGDIKMVEKESEIMRKVKEAEERIGVAKMELKAKMKVYEERV